MEKSKKTLGLLTLALSALALTACPPKVVPEKCPPHDYGEWTVKTEATETRDGEKVATCKKCGKEKSEKINRLGFPYNVTFKDAEGNVISSETKRSIEKITKPADPTAPAGKVFYGWKNVKNGGQIWDFDDDILGLVSQDSEFVPVFVPANMNAQYLEAELEPTIIAKPMYGATYSGGASGQQMIYIDRDREYNSTCEVGEFKYYSPAGTDQIVVGDAPAGVEQKTMNPKSSNMGAFVHFNYKKGNVLTFNIESSAAVDDVMLFASFSSEYGKEDPTTYDKINRFTDEGFKVSVNGTRLEYDKITMHNVPAIGDFLKFQDFLLGVNVSLNAGSNTITMLVDNEEGYSGTLPSASPCIDSIKLYTSATITWNEANYANIVK